MNGIDTYLGLLASVGTDDAVRSSVMLTIALEDIYLDQDHDPVSKINDVIQRQINF